MSSYHTIETIYKKIKEFSPNDKINLDVKNVKYMKVSVDETGKIDTKKNLWTKKQEDWNVLCFPSGESLVSEFLELCKTFEIHQGENLVGFLINNTFWTIPVTEEIKPLIHYTLERKNIPYEETHLPQLGIKRHIIDKCLKIQELSDSDVQVYKAFVKSIPGFCKENLSSASLADLGFSIYSCQFCIYFSLDEVKKAFPYIENIEQYFTEEDKVHFCSIDLNALHSLNNKAEEKSKIKSKFKPEPKGKLEKSMECVSQALKSLKEAREYFLEVNHQQTIEKLDEAEKLVRSEISKTQEDFNKLAKLAKLTSLPEPILLPKLTELTQPPQPLQTTQSLQPTQIPKLTELTQPTQPQPLQQDSQCLSNEEKRKLPSVVDGKIYKLKDQYYTFDELKQMFELGSFKITKFIRPISGTGLFKCSKMLLVFSN